MHSVQTTTFNVYQADLDAIVNQYTLKGDCHIWTGPVNKANRPIYKFTDADTSWSVVYVLGCLFHSDAMVNEGLDVFCKPKCSNGISCVNPKHLFTTAPALPRGARCPECASTLYLAEGCETCPGCGYSKCS